MSMENVTSPPSPDEERARLRAAREKREKARLERAKTLELEVLRLEDRFEASLGPRGSMFEIVETVEGPIVIRLGEGILFTRFQASKVTASDVHDFVFPCLEYPEKEKYLEIVANRPEIAGRCAHALMSLFGSKHKDDSGKF